MHGVECYYLPRSYATTNTVIREVVQSEFNNAYPLELMLNLMMVMVVRVTFFPSLEFKDWMI